jgi:hypothetical protein
LTDRDHLADLVGRDVRPENLAECGFKQFVAPVTKAGNPTGES